VDCPLGASLRGPFGIIKVRGCDGLALDHNLIFVIDIE
jgi:hypothetical protein